MQALQKRRPHTAKIVPFKVVPVDEFNYLDDERLLYDNAFSVPEIFIPGFKSTKPYNIWYGSRYSGKSRNKAMHYLLKATGDDYFRAVFARMTQRAAKKSQFQLFLDLLKQYPLLQRQFEVSKSEMKLEHKRTGNFLQGGSFEQSDALMSIPDLTHIWVEEPVTRGISLGRTAFEDMAGTLRNQHGVPVQFDMTFNPIIKSSFIYEDFFEELKYDAHIIHANYYHNPYCPDDRVDFLNNMKIVNPNRYRVDGMGLWGNVLTGWEYYGSFERAVAEEKAVIRPLPIHITYDFNTKPYMSAVVNQIYHLPDGRVCFHAIKDYAVKPPRATVKHTCRAILDEWEPHIKKYGMFYYGDASGNNSMPVDEARNLYALVEKHMGGYAGHTNKRVSKTNRRHRTRATGGPMGRMDLMEKIMSDQEQFVYRIDPACKLLIEDYENVQIGPNGGKSKKKTKVGGVLIEKHGHLSDAQDYFLAWHMRYQFKL